MRIKRKCDLCGGEYYAQNGRSRYCSDTCRKTAIRRNYELWKAKHPGYFREYAAAHKQQKEAADV